MDGVWKEDDMNREENTLARRRKDVITGKTDSGHIATNTMLNMRRNMNMKNNQLSMKSRLIMIIAILIAMLIAGSAFAAQGLDREGDSNSAGAKNLVSYASYELTDSGEVRAKLTLNAAYAGIGRRSWTIYAVEIIGEETNVVKETFEDQGISTNLTPAFNHTFRQGTAVFFGAYTDITERQQWQNTGDESELIANGMDVVIPSVPADPKSQARTYTSKDSAETYRIDQQTVNGSFYIRLNCEKDTYLKINSFSSTAEFTQYMLLAKEGEKDETRAAEGNEFYLEKGTYFLWSSSNGATLNLSFTMRHHVHATGIAWTVDGKALKNGPVELRKGISVTIKATLQPENTDARLTKTGLDNKNSGYGQIYDESLSEDGKTLTFKYLCNDQNGNDTVSVVAYDIGYRNEGWTKYELALGVKPSKPEFTDSMVTSTHNMIELNCRNMVDTRAYLRAEIKNGKKWVKKLDEQVIVNGNTGTTHYIKGLKENTEYTVRVQYYTKVGDREIKSEYTTLKVKTGVKTKPSIKSVKLSNVKSQKTWVDGHWVNGTVKDVWVKGHYDYYKTFKVTVVLSKAAPSGVIGLAMTNDAETNGKPQFVKVGKDKKTFVFSGSAAGKNLKVSFQFYSDAKYKGYSPVSSSKTVQVK